MIGQRHCAGCDLVEHSLREGDAVECVLGAVAVVDRDFGPAQAAAVPRHRGEDVRAERLVGIFDGDRVILAEVVQLAAVRPPLVRVAPHIKLPRRAADEDRDRLACEPGIGCRLGGVAPLNIGGRGGGLRGCGCVLLCFQVGLGGVELRA
jgi:hypothetical protein